MIRPTPTEIAKAVKAHKEHGVRVEYKKYPDGSHSVIVDAVPVEEEERPQGSYRL